MSYFVSYGLKESRYSEDPWTTESTSKDLEMRTAMDYDKTTTTECDYCYRCH